MVGRAETGLDLRHEASRVAIIEFPSATAFAEIRLEAPVRLFATVGTAALVVGSLGAAVLAATETHLTPYQCPSRNVPVAAGDAAGQFVVALSGSIEEWDPQTARRLTPCASPQFTRSE